MPSLLEAKDIAEEGFIYGLPLVINYAIMYDYAVDRNSGQYKAPFNQIKNEPNVHTYKDTAIVRPILSSGWICGRSRLCSRAWRLTRSAITRSCSVMAILTTTAISAPGNRKRTGNYMVVGPDWKGDTPAGIKVFRSSTQFSLAGYRTQLLGPDDLDNVKKVQAGYKVQMLSTYLKQTLPKGAPAVDFPRIDKDLVKSNFFEYSTKVLLAAGLV